MQSISTYHEALKAIWDRSGFDRGFISNPFAGDDAARLGLIRTQTLLDHAGFTELPYAIVHVAGSKGKGSTCTLVDAMLRAANLRTGRFLSPHLHSFRERFVINGELISESEFIHLTSQFVTLAEQVEQQHPELGGITAFELNTAMALAWFAQRQCEVAVIEVGMGGELDSTNIVTPTVSVITTLDFEHTAILGSTIAEIATNKAGIIKADKPVFSAQQPPEAMQVIATRATDLHAPLAIAGQDWQVVGTWNDFQFTRDDTHISGLECSLVGAHQLENAGLAIATVLRLSQDHPHLNIDESDIRTGISSARIPARFEQIRIDSGQTIVIDGAHTPASTAALAAAVEDRFPNARVAVVIGMLADKLLEPSLAPLGRIASKWIAVAPSNPRAVEADQLQKIIRDLGHEAETATALAAAVEDRFPNARVAVVIGMLADKLLEPSLAPLGRIASKWIAVAPSNPRAVEADQLQKIIRDLGHEAETAIRVRDGIDLAAHTDADVIVITGSFSTAAEARVALNLAEVIDPPM